MSVLESFQNKAVLTEGVFADKLHSTMSINASLSVHYLEEDIDGDDYEHR